MKESGVDLSFDAESGVEGDSNNSSSSSPKINKASNSTGTRTNLTGRHKQRMRYQAKLMLLKQQHEQSQEIAQKMNRKVYLPSTHMKTLAMPELAETAGLPSSLLEGHQVQANPLKYQYITTSSSLHRSSSVGTCELSPDQVNSPLTSTPEAQMKFNAMKSSFSSDLGFADSNDSNGTSVSEMSEADHIFLGNVVEVKVLDEISLEQQEELSQIIAHASYTEGISELLNGGKSPVLPEMSSSCPIDTSQQPKYRGGRKKEAPPPNMTAEQRIQWEKERQKKDNHNHIERRRRDKINDCIRILANIVPSGDNSLCSNNNLLDNGNSDTHRKEYNNKKGAVLEKSVKYIRHLQNEHKKMDEVRRQHTLLETQNRLLKLQVQQLEMRAQQVHLSSSPVVQLQQQMLPIQYQPQSPQLQPLSQQHLQSSIEMQHLEMLMSQNPQFVTHVESPTQQQYVNEYLHFVQSPGAGCQSIAIGGQFDDGQFHTSSENNFYDQQEGNLRDLAMNQHVFDEFPDAIPESMAAMELSTDDLDITSHIHLNNDPLLSTANNAFEEDLFSTLLLK